MVEDPGERALDRHRSSASRLGERLAQEFGRGFKANNLRRMVQFAHTFTDAAIVETLSRQSKLEPFGRSGRESADAAPFFARRGLSAANWLDDPLGQAPRAET